MAIQDTLSNPWVFQIASGAVASVLASVVIGWLRRGARRKQLEVQAAQANRDVLASLRTSVAEGVLPADETVWALIRSSARRHNVDASLVWTPSQIADELVHEIMDNPFLSGEDKARLADGLAGLRLADMPAPEDSAGIQAPEPRSFAIGGRFILPLLSAALAIYVTNALGLELTWSSLLVWLVIVVGVVGATVILAAIVFVLVSNLGKSDADEKNTQEAPAITKVT